MKVLIVDNGSRHIDDLSKFFDGNRTVIISYRKITQALITWADLVVLSGGSKAVVPHRLLYAREMSLIHSDRTTPIIGICLGFERIGKAFGLKIKKGNKVRGLRKIRLNWEGLRLKEAVVYQAHKWRIVQVGEFLKLGESALGAEIIKHQSRPIIGFQFHPEVSVPKNDGIELLRHAIETLTL